MGDNVGGDKIVQSGEYSVGNSAQQHTHNNFEGVRVNGDTFSNIGAGATIINRSLLVNSMNRLREAGDGEVAAALHQIAEFIDRSGNPDAVENFDAIAEELDRPKPRKVVLKSLWEGALVALPAITQLTEAVDKVKVLFS